MIPAALVSPAGLAGALRPFGESRMLPRSAYVDPAVFAWERAHFFDSFDPGYAVEFWDITNRQDWRACESVQRGLSSPHARPGPLTQRGRGLSIRDHGRARVQRRIGLGPGFGSVG